DFDSSQHALLTKMILCATASESNTNREGTATEPTLERAANGPNGFPTGKDQNEGYGMLNPDAAVEALSQAMPTNAVQIATLGGTETNRRAWARSVQLTAGQTFSPVLANPAGGDFDLYFYSGTPNAFGTPVLLASSTQAG